MNENIIQFSIYFKKVLGAKYFYNFVFKKPMLYDFAYNTTISLAPKQT